MSCYMCGSKNAKKISKLCSNMKILGDWFPDGETNVVVCKKCGNVYSDINATQEDFNNYYKSPSAQALSYYEVYGEEHTNEYFSDILNIFKDKINENSEIVDIASGVGDFSLFLKNKNYKNVTGLDISQRCIDILDKKGINSILSDTKNVDKKYYNKFDMAIFGHSLEHYLDFKTALLTVKKMLKKDGYIYIETPDAERYCDIDAVPYTMFTYEHTFHLTTETMVNIARVCGLQLLKSGTFFKADSYHVVFGLFKNGGDIEEPVYSDKTKSAVEKYVQYSKENILPAIKPFEFSQEELILWGIGASTALLLNETFDNCNVKMLIDRNPARQGLRYSIGSKNLIIQDPSIIKDNSATIVVLPYWYKDSIIKQIKEMGFKNKLITLS